MERQCPAPWTFGGLSVVVLLALSWLGAAGLGLWTWTQVPRTGPERSLVSVIVTDGADARLWIERPGAAARAMPLACEVAPGPVALRVARHTAQGAWRQDIVEMDLKPGRLHLVPIGGEPVKIEAQQGRETPRELRLRHPFPGVVSRSVEDSALGLGEPRQEPVPLDATLSAHPTSDPEGWLPANERLLLAANPFVWEVRVSVAAQHGDKALDWRQECTLPPLGCRVFALGAASGVRVSCARADDGAVLGDSAYTPPLAPGRRLLYTVGGATVYAWFGRVVGTMPPVPKGEWAELPEGLPVRARRPEDPWHWVLVAGGPGGTDVGLSPITSAPVSALRPAGPVQARADVVARELALAAQLKDKAVSAVVAVGEDLWGLVDGVVHDLRAGTPLHAREPELVAQMTATPWGIVLLTRGGQLATLRDGRLVLGARMGDPALRLAPATGEPPAVWLYGGSFADAMLWRQPLDGSPGTSASRSGGQGAQATENTEGEPAPEGEEGTEGECAEVEPCTEAEPCAEAAPCAEAEPVMEGEQGTWGEQSEQQPICVTAIALASGDGMLLASGRRIERMQPNADTPGVWSIDPVLTLPEGGSDVIGILDLDGLLLFSTEECVYELRGNLVLPLVEGIGGTLVPWRGGLVVCDARSGRLYHLSVPAFRAPAKGEPR